MSDKAVKIPMTDCGLEISVGDDGVWLIFKSSNGQHYDLNASTLEPHGKLVGFALRSWCADREKQAAAIRQQEARDDDLRP